MVYERMIHCSHIGQGVENMFKSIFMIAGLGIPVAVAGAIMTRESEPAPDVAPAVAQAETPVLGMNVHELKPSAYQLLREMGISHVRNTIYLPLWNENSSYRAGKAAQAKQALELGIETMFVVHNAWGDVFSTEGTAERERVKREALRSMMEIAREIPEAEALQLWNEVDVWVQAPFGSANGDEAFDVGRDYGEWFIGAYESLKAINPDLLVVTSGTADHASGRWEGFLEGMVSTPGFRADAVSIHAYGSWPRVRDMALRAREIIDPSGIPLWITEGGTSATGYDWSPQQHANAWRSVIEGNNREKIAARFYPYCLETDPRYPAHGLFNPDGTERPILDYLRTTGPARIKARSASG